MYTLAYNSVTDQKGGRLRFIHRWSLDWLEDCDPMRWTLD